MKPTQTNFLRATVALLTLSALLAQPLLLFGQENDSADAQSETGEAVGVDTVEQDAAAATNELAETGVEAQEEEVEATTTRSPRERVSIGASLTVRENESVRETVAIFGGSTVEGEVTREMVTVFGDATMNGSVDREMVTILGDATMNGSVGREMVTVLGNAEVNGPVERELVVVFGNLKLGPDAKVGRDCVVVFGRVERHPDAELNSEPLPILPWMGGVGDYIRAGPLMGRPMVPSSLIAWVVVGLHFVLYFLIALILPKPVAACHQKIALKPLASFGVGLLAMIILAPLYFILVATGIGIVLIPLLELAVMIFSAVGRTAMMQYFGARLLGRPMDQTTESPLFKFIVGFALVTLIYMVPVLGLLFWAVLRPFGLGCALLALFSSGSRNGNGRRPAPIRMQQTASPQAGPPPVHAFHVQTGTTEASNPTASGSSETSFASAQPEQKSAAEVDSDSLPRAGFWIRTAASALDFLPLILIFSFTGRYFLLIWLTYHIALWAWKGTTLGGIICKLKVVRMDGRETDFATALVRGLASIFSALPLMLGFFWVGWTAERRSWHDIIAGTVIVRVPKSVSLI
jgi:cytoskeletal protein CcmA (bactofilin family)